MKAPREGLSAAAALAALVIVSLGLSACGSSQGPNNPPNTNNNGYLTLPQGAASPSPIPQAQGSPQDIPPMMAPAAPPPTYPQAPRTFPLTPVMGVTGSVTIVVTSASSFTVSVAATGLAPGSTHAVHLHFGNCPSAGVHITALSSLTAGPSGSGSSSTTVRMAYQGDGRFVIVYAGPNPGPLAACAQLAS